MKPRQTLRRLALREYAPLIGWVACWAAVAAAIGHADAVRLLAATMFVRSLRFLTAPSTWIPLRRRIGAPPAIRRSAIEVALGMEMVALLAAATGLAGFIYLFLELEQHEMAVLLALLAVGMPARYFYPLIGGRTHAHFSRSMLSWTGAALVALAWALHGGLVAVALAIAAREWVALAAALIWAKPIKSPRARDDKLHWQEIADLSRANSRRRLTYRVGKGVLSMFLGPLGGFVARTGRGMNLDRKLVRFAPTHEAALALLMLAVGGLAFGLIVLLPEPVMLVAAASAMRVAAAAGNLLIWSHLGSESAVVEDSEDEEDD